MNVCETSFDKIQTESMGYINMDIIIPKILYTEDSSLSLFSASISSYNIHIMSIINNVFIKIHSLGYTIMHRRLSYTCNHEIKEMYKHETLLDLPTRIKLNKS